MADRIQYLEFTVYLATREEAAAEQARFPNGVQLHPDGAAELYSAPVVLAGDTAPFFAPSTRSSYFTATSKYPRNVRIFETCRGGWFGICALFGRETTYVWVAKFAYMAPSDPETETGEPAENIQQRSWIDGFEIGGDATFWGGGGPGLMMTREDSRHVDGYGLAYRSMEQVGEYVQHTVYENGAAARARSWERFYIKIRQLPSTAATIWLCRGSASLASGIHLDVSPSGSLIVYNVNAAGTRFLIATSSDTLTVAWTKVDILLEFSPVVSGTGRFRVFLNGVLAIDVSQGSNVGLGQAQNHDSSRIGNGNNVANTLECSFDDWMCATIPPTFYGIDWLNGSKIVAVSPRGFGSGNVFGGEWASLLRNPFRGSLTGSWSSWVQDAVSASLLAVTTDAAETIDQVNGSLGCVAIKVDVTRGTNTGTGKIGYKIGAAAAVDNNVAEGAASMARGTTLYTVSGVTTPPAATPLELRYTRGAHVTLTKVYRLMAEAELVGVFGDEDIVQTEEEVTTDPIPRLGPHNGPYPRTIWARSQYPPTSPVIVYGGTYTGNGNATGGGFKTLQFRAPVNWFFTRPASTTERGVRWWSSMVGSHQGNEEGLFVEGMIRAEEDTSFVPIGGDNDPEERYQIHITGNHASYNQNGVTYQYIAVMDPGARFMLNGGMAHNAAVTTTMVNDLKDETYTPVGAWLVKELIAESGTATLGFKGPGNAATGYTPLQAAESTNVMTFGTGAVDTHYPNGHQSGRAIAYNLWRLDDGSGDPNSHKVVKIGSYTGNGAASRTITFAPATGVRPMYAEVIPLNGSNTIRRDPSHTGTQSSTATGTIDAAAGITSGGVDEMTVGSSLNTNAVVYNYFVLMGCVTAGNNGWSQNCEAIYVEPEYPGGPIDPPPEPIDPDPEEPEPTPPGTECVDGGGGATCISMSTRVVNLALIEIGVTKVLTNYCTQTTKEAELARQVFDQCVRHTLITYPWPFATKYAVLALTATQPTDEDWTYAYRMPTDCIFPRRIVVARGMAVDPSPPPMGLSSDASGGIILTNEQNAVLEYTARPTCVAVVADELFREALKWRLAAALAPPLTRIPGEADRCLKMFEIIVQKAESVVKQGVPGARPEASTLDQMPAALVANIQVVNRALVRIGARTIANLTLEQSREAVAANLIFEDELRATLCAHPWAFCTRYGGGEVIAVPDPGTRAVMDMTLVDGSPENPVNADWIYSHRLPTDCMVVRRLAVAGTGRKFDANPQKFRTGSDAEGGLLYSDVEEPMIEYTSRLENILLYADSVFCDAFAWRLAASLAPSLANVELHRPEQLGRGPETPQDPMARNSRRFNDQQRRTMIAQWAWAMYNRTLEQAQVVDRNEAQEEPLQDAEWIRGRQ